MSLWLRNIRGLVVSSRGVTRKGGSSKNYVGKSNIQT